jgi:hypothetical protein
VPVERPTRSPQPARWRRATAGSGEPPPADAEGRRTPALRSGDPRVMGLAGALCQTLLAATGFTGKNLRVLTAGLLGSAYTLAR